MLRRFLLTVFSTAAVLALPTTVRAEYIVDNFTSPSGTTTISLSVSPPHTWNQNDSISGASRSITVQSTSGKPSVFGGVTGFLGYNSFDNVTGFGVYSGDIAPTSTLNYTFSSPMDFSTIPNAGVVLTFASSSMNTPFAVTLGDGSSTATGTAQTTGTPGVYYIPFEDLTGTVDYTSIDTLQVVINGNPGAKPGADYVLTEVKIAPVPAPAGLILGLVALPVAGLWRLRRRNG